MSVTTAAALSGRTTGPGFGGNASSSRLIDLVRQARARRAAKKAGAVGNATPAVGGDNGRLDSIESRITALEGGGSDNVTDAAGVKTGGAGFQEMATVTSGTMPEAQATGSLTEAMPGPAGASMDMFGSEFARNSAVGAAKMIKNKKI